MGISYLLLIPGGRTALTTEQRGLMRTRYISMWLVVCLLCLHHSSSSAARPTLSLFPRIPFLLPAEQGTRTSQPQPPRHGSPCLAVSCCPSLSLTLSHSRSPTAAQVLSSAPSCTRCAYHPVWSCCLKSPRPPVSSQISHRLTTRHVPYSLTVRRLPQYSQTPNQTPKSTCLVDL